MNHDGCQSIFYIILEKNSSKKIVNCSINKPMSWSISKINFVYDRSVIQSMLDELLFDKAKHDKDSSQIGKDHETNEEVV